MEKTHSEIRKRSVACYVAAMICLLFLWVVGAAAVSVTDNVVKDPTDVPTADTFRTGTGEVTVHLDAVEVVANLTSDKKYYFWTYALNASDASKSKDSTKATVPGPMIRAREGDTITIVLTNKLENAEPHDIDLHAVMGPGGGAAVTNVMPGQTATLIFKAMRAGAYTYHCAAEGKPWEHVSHGMYGLIMVEPKGGLKKVDKEFYVAQGEWYLKPAPNNDPAIANLFDLDENKAMTEHPDYFTFNGHTDALKTIKNMYVNQKDKVRMFFVTGGPDIGSNFHIIGQIFDKVYTGDPDNFTRNEETVYIAPGDAAVFEFETLVPGKYLLVDHALWRASKGASGFLNVNKTKSWPFDIYDSIPRIFS